jgi:hypothetical protein
MLSFPKILDFIHRSSFSVITLYKKDTILYMILLFCRKTVQYFVLSLFQYQMNFDEDVSYPVVMLYPDSRTMDWKTVASSRDTTLRVLYFLQSSSLPELVFFHQKHVFLRNQFFLSSAGTEHLTYYPCYDIDFFYTHHHGIGVHASKQYTEIETTVLNGLVIPNYDPHNFYHQKYNDVLSRSLSVFRQKRDMLRKSTQTMKKFLSLHATVEKQYSVLCSDEKNTYNFQTTIHNMYNKKNIERIRNKMRSMDPVLFQDHHLRHQACCSMLMTMKRFHDEFETLFLCLLQSFHEMDVFGR